MTAIYKLWLLERYSETRCCPFIKIRVKPYLTMHEIHQILRDCQAQTSTTKSSGGTRVCLTERFEQPFLDFLFNANTSILDCEFYRHRVRRVVDNMSSQLHE